MTEEQLERKKARYKKWYAANREQRLPAMREFTRVWSLKRRYGLSSEDFDTLLKSQGGRCAMCGKKKRLQVDHDHRIGAGNRQAVRALVCSRCNCETFRLIEKRLANGEDFWALAQEYRSLGLTPEKATYLAQYLRIQ